MIKIDKPEELYLEIKRLRDKEQFYDEIKWSRIYNKNVKVYQKMLELFFDHATAKFSCYVFPKTEIDLKRHFNKDLYAAYQAFAAMQVQANLGKEESVILLMDDMNTPTSVKLEANIKRKVNTKFNRNAVYGVCRVYSKGVELIQLADLLLGAVAYDFKIKYKALNDPGKAKSSVLNHVKRLSGIKDFTVDPATRKMNVWTFKAK